MSGGYFEGEEETSTGGQPVLEKPFNLEQVRAVLRDVVGPRQPPTAA